MNRLTVSYIFSFFLFFAAIPLQGHGSHAFDCQGNIRVVMGEDGTLEQVTHYYPFGGIYGDAGLNAEFQPYKYNGKELERLIFNIYKRIPPTGGVHDAFRPPAG